MSETKLAAESRTEFGKGYARRARVAGRIPAVIYGNGTETQHITLPAREFTLATRVKNAALTLELDGKEIKVVVKEIQRNAVRQEIEHADLVVA